MIEYKKTEHDLSTLTGRYMYTDEILKALVTDDRKVINVLKRLERVLNVSLEEIEKIVN